MDKNAELKKELNAIDDILGNAKVINIGGREVKIYPVRLIDYTELVKCASVLLFDNLYEIARMKFIDFNGLESLDKLLSIVTREECPELSEIMIAGDWPVIRNIIIEQNELQSIMKEADDQVKKSKKEEDELISGRE